MVDGSGRATYRDAVAAIARNFRISLYLIVGGGSNKGDMEEHLKRLAQNKGIADSVRFCGRQTPEDLMWYYGAADVQVMATEYEGWSHVLLEAIACGFASRYDARLVATPKW